MLNSDLEICIDNAVVHIKKKEKKKSKQENVSISKIFHKKKYVLMNEEILSAAELQIRLDEGKKAILTAASQNNRQWIRRLAVSERNETERQLIRRTIKSQIIAHQINEYYG